MEKEKHLVFKEIEVLQLLRKKITPQPQSTVFLILEVSYKKQMPA